MLGLIVNFADNIEQISANYLTFRFSDDFKLIYSLKFGQY